MSSYLARHREGFIDRKPAASVILLPCNEVVVPVPQVLKRRVADVKLFFDRRFPTYGEDVDSSGPDHAADTVRYGCLREERLPR